jgi:predicted alpha/beta hydrolase
MDPTTIRKQLEGIVEELAAEEHRRWAHWQKHLHSVCINEEDGSLRIPVRFVKKWERQIQLEYHDLADSEKASDREQVARYLPIIVRALTSSE